jgi:hypothetical protein
VEKLHFSCVAADCLPDSLLARKQVIVCGMETHVCVLQTVLQLLAQGKQVFVVADAVASRRDSDKQLGLQRMQAAGAVLVSREMVLFEMLGVAGSELFKAMSKVSDGYNRAESDGLLGVDVWPKSGLFGQTGRWRLCRSVFSFADWRRTVIARRREQSPVASYCITSSKWRARNDKPLIILNMSIFITG